MSYLSMECNLHGHIYRTNKCHLTPTACLTQNDSCPEDKATEYLDPTPADGSYGEPNLPEESGAKQVFSDVMYRWPRLVLVPLIILPKHPLLPSGALSALLWGWWFSPLCTHPTTCTGLGQRVSVTHVLPATIR